jgi:L-malate glycosyltransferase
VRFVIAGRILENDHYQALLASVAENCLEGRVQFLGGVDRVFDLLSASDVFFLPSRSEGMSNALLEAMACGLPAVASRVGGNPELIRDGVTGFLVPVEDAEAAADRLLTLISDRNKARAMGEAARTVVESQYTMEATVRLIIDEYERLLGSK